ncbi:MAG: DUF1800 family protein [Janthinobacterium lividum]
MRAPIFLLRLLCSMLLLVPVPAALAGTDGVMGVRQARHLLDRLGYGPAPGDVARVRAMGVEGYVDSQLAPPALPRYLEIRLRGAGAEDARLLRAIASPRQLEEVLTAFWLAQFGIAADKGWDAAQAAAVGRDAVRPYVFARYAVLRAAVARHPALRGRAVGPNERAAMHALARQFVAAPPAALLRALEEEWDRTQGDQRAVLRRLFTHPAFLAPAEAGSKRKDAFRFVVSAVRAAGLVVEDVAPLRQLLDAREPLTQEERTAFATRLAAGGLPLALAPQRQRWASSAPPLRAAKEGEAEPGTVAGPGPALMEAPTPSAAAMASARSRPDHPEELKALLQSEDFLRY